MWCSDGSCGALWVLGLQLLRQRYESREITPCLKGLGDLPLRTPLLAGICSTLVGAGILQVNIMRPFILKRWFFLVFAKFVGCAQ